MSTKSANSEETSPGVIIMGSVDTEVDSPSSNDDDPTLLTDPSPGRTRKPKLGPKTRSVQLRGHAGAENRSYKQSPQVTFAGGPDFVSSSPKNGESPFADERDAVASSTLVMAWDGGKSEPLTSEQRQEEHHKKCRLDMDTGRHILRCQSVLQLSGNRQAGECRWRHWLKENFLRGGKAGSEAVTGNAASLPDPADSRCGGASVCSDSEEQRTRRVYRVRSLYQFHHSSQQELVSGSNVSLLSDYIRWTFRASFFQVTLASYVEFLGLIIMFALFIWAVGIYQPECIFGGEFTSDLAPSFVDAFHLSWTTLSTVGYGIIAPNINPTKSTGARCFGINVLMAVEAFAGVLFAGVLGAILVGKVARIQSVAQVRFSDPICVRYGSGVLECMDDDEDNGLGDTTVEKGENNVSPKEIPCPVLEFRIVNDLSEEKGGEIVNASVVVVATTLAEMDEAELSEKEVSSRVKSNSNHLLSPIAKGAGFAAGTAAKAAGMAAGATAMVVGTAAKQTGAALFGAGKFATQATGTMFQRINNTVNRSYHGSSFGSAIAENDEEADAFPFSASARQREIEQEFAERVKEAIEKEQYRLGGIAMKENLRATVAVDEGNSSLAPTRVFHKLEIETDSHPFFRRVWNIRHCLDENSPLLTARARRAIERNRGFWPEEWNDHSSVRSQLRFTELIVSFGGTANVSGSSVYAQKVYDFADVNIGYTFAQVLHISQSGQLVVDKRLLNDVLEQDGGGAEPFQDIIGYPDTLSGLVSEVQGATQQIAAHAAQTVQTAAEKTLEAATLAAEKTSDLALQTKAFVEQPRKRPRGSGQDGVTAECERSGVDLESGESFGGENKQSP